ncbi:MAG: hypothetical protein CVT67_09155 [Actinobacteria bacterium HGW-Actinobacteria-7]|jgi:nitroreductase|nr:MAG: hypothetical protein CVT67_09155 [Actinobacteria bacterium HGW-Actinobacteria-7]
MDFWQVVESRHSVRDFSNEPLARESIERVLHAASLAPSVRNSQPWRFHVATGVSRVRVGAVIAQTTAHIAEYMSVLGPELYELTLKWFSELGGAPAVIGVSIVPAEDELESINTLLSTGTAIENLLLAATAEGLAACNITFLKWVTADLESALQVSADRRIIAVIAVGHPGELPGTFPPKNVDIADWLD